MLCTCPSFHAAPATMKRVVPHWARARPCPVSPDTLLVLLDTTDVTVGHLLAGSAAVASLTADMVTRKDDSVKLACGDVATACAALVHSTNRVAYQCGLLFAATYPYGSQAR